MSNYQLASNGYVIRLDDGAWVPPEPTNRDWREYQSWLALGNTPVPITDTLATRKVAKQLALDNLFGANFDLTAFIKAGTATNITANNIGSFLATITNNYRTKRAAITAAADTTALNAIDINSGWPSNP